MRFASACLSQSLLTVALLSSCNSEPGALFSASGVNAAGVSAAGRSFAVAGNESAGGGIGGADEQGGAVSGGADNGGANESAGASSVAGRAAGGTSGSGAAASAGAATAGGPSGGAGAGGSPEPSACDGHTVNPDAQIANFEAGVDGWFGYFGDAPFGVDATQPGAAGTEHALRFAGGKAKTSGFFHLLPCSDLSSFDGIQFWARSSSADPVRFLAVIPATDPTPAVGDCREPPMKCSDHPGKVFTFSKEWQLYRAPFLELKQYGWGTKAKFAGVINAVLWINDGPVDGFDLSIDEVSLYSNAAG